MARVETGEDLKKQSEKMKGSPHLAYMCELPFLTEPVTQNRRATSMCETNEITTGKKAQEEGHGSYRHRRLTRIKRETLWPFPHQVPKTNADLLNFKLTQSTSLCQERAGEFKALRSQRSIHGLGFGCLAIVMVSESFGRKILEGTHNPWRKFSTYHLS